MDIRTSLLRAQRLKCMYSSINSKKVMLAVVATVTLAVTPAVAVELTVVAAEVTQAVAIRLSNSRCIDVSSSSRSTTGIAAAAELILTMAVVIDATLEVK